MKTGSHRQSNKMLFLILLASGFGIGAMADSDGGGHVYLSGEVHAQGAVEIPADGKLTVSQAIIIDGGLGDFGDPEHIKIIRKNGEGTSQIIKINLNEIVGGGPADHPIAAHLEKDVELKPGDVIMVPRRQASF